jgi:hypothetical protein
MFCQGSIPTRNVEFEPILIDLLLRPEVPQDSLVQIAKSRLIPEFQPRRFRLIPDRVFKVAPFRAANRISFYHAQETVVLGKAIIAIVRKK